jgi:nitrogen-specific signal transduction histidine kinase
LIISYRIVADRHHGELEFESKPGHTVFLARLPMTRQALEPSTEAKEPPPEGAV